MANCQYIIDHGYALAKGWNKLATGAPSVSMTCDEALAAYPITNAVNKIPSKPVMFDDTGDADIFFSFPQSQKCSYFGIIGHNFHPNVTLTLKNDADSDKCLTPDLNLSITLNAEEIHTLIAANQSNRYWKLEIRNGQPASGNMLIGELIAGEPFEFTQNFSWGVDHVYDHNVITHKTDYDQVWSYYMNRIRSLTGMSFEDISDTTAGELIDMIEASRGSLYPLVMIWDDTNPNKSIYGKIKDQLKRDFNFVSVNNVTGLTVTGLPFAKTILE